MRSTWNMCNCRRLLACRNSSCSEGSPVVCCNVCRACMQEDRRFSQGAGLPHMLPAMGSHCSPVVSAKLHAGSPANPPECRTAGLPLQPCSVRLPAMGSHPDCKVGSGHCNCYHLLSVMSHTRKPQSLTHSDSSCKGTLTNIPMHPVPTSTRAQYSNQMWKD